MADLSVTSAPRTKDFDLFISHNTKDSSYTVYHPVQSGTSLSAGTTVPIYVAASGPNTGLARDR